MNRPHRPTRRQSDLQRLVADAKALLDDAGVLAGSNVEALKAKLKAALNEFKEEAAAVASSIRKGTATVDHTVRANPYQTMGIAAGTGFVAGYLVSRRRFRRF